MNERQAGMTGYTIQTGSNEKYSSGWDQIFSSETTKPTKKKKVKEEKAKKKDKPEAKKKKSKHKK
jgi:hypothetical protein